MLTPSDSDQDPECDSGLDIESSISEHLDLNSKSFYAITIGNQTQSIVGMDQLVAKCSFSKAFKVIQAAK